MRDRAEPEGTQARADEANEANQANTTGDRLLLLGEIAAGVAHELVGALQLISSNVYLARQSPAESATPLARIEHGVRLAQAIVDDVLSLARGEPLPTEPTQVSEVLVRARDSVPRSSVTPVTFVDDVPAGLTAELHPLLAARLVHALYDNAVRAAAPGAVTVWTRATASVDSGEITLEVTDDGPGVPPGLRATLFAPLTTGRRDVRGDHRGTGLGLALARRIALAHKGRLVLDETYGPGARFRWHIPGSRPDVPDGERVALPPTSP